MRKPLLCIMLCITALLLAACGGSREAKPGAGTVPSQQPEAQAEAATAETALLSDEEVMAMASSQAEQGTTEEVASAPPEPAENAAQADRSVDLDLTAISGTVVYSQVYDMIMDPDSYMGKTIKMKGSFSYYQDPDTQQEYFAVIIADATACCAQGIEFVWKGEHVYPRDYPPLDTEITVTGTFSTYSEGDYMYLQLTGADVSW